MKRAACIVILMLLCCSCMHAQTIELQERIATTLQKIATTKEDTSKLKLYIELSFSLAGAATVNEPVFEDEAISLAEKLSNSPDKKISGYGVRGNAALKTGLGLNHWRSGRFDKALQYHFDALKIYKALGETRHIEELTINIGQDYADKGSYSEALHYFRIALDLYKQSGNLSQQAACYLFFAFVYGSMGNSGESAKWNYEALKIFEKLGDQYAATIAASNLAGNYVELKKYDEALMFYNRSLEVLKKNKDEINRAGVYCSIGNLYETLGNYVEAFANYMMALDIGREIHDGYCLGQAYEYIAGYYIKRGNMDSALTNLFASEKAYMAVGNLQSGANICCRIGDLYLGFHDYKNAKAYFNKAVTVSEGLDNLHVLGEYYQGIQSVDSAGGDWKNAYTHFRKYIFYSDSASGIENSEASIQTVLQYEFDKKEAAAKAAQEKTDIKQRNFRNSVMGGAGFLFILVLVLFNRYRFKQRANKSLQTAYINLQTAQQQLIEAERKATFGEMATRMAHEIQNPLNFVNNFSALTSELVEEIATAHDAAERQEAIHLLKQNLMKIGEHGKRASVIVKQLQEHTNEGTIHAFFENDKFVG